MRKVKYIIIGMALAIGAAAMFAMRRAPSWLHAMRDAPDLTLWWGAGWQMTDDVGHSAAGHGFCSTSFGTYTFAGNPVKNYGYYCWCRMTKPKIGRWVFQHAYESDELCHAYCAMNCGDHISRIAAFRKSVLTPAGN
jgi:hypothetical protein